jgi:hypothetical protein
VRERGRGISELLNKSNTRGQKENNIQIHTVIGGEINVVMEKSTNSIYSILFFFIFLFLIRPHFDVLPLQLNFFFFFRFVSFHTRTNNHLQIERKKRMARRGAIDIYTYKREGGGGIG